jgi:hypothetical protein
MIGLAATVVVLALSATLAFAFTFTGGLSVSSNASLSGNGTNEILTVGGPVKFVPETAPDRASLTRGPKCPKNYAITVSVTITQGKHVAKGHWSHTCTGGQQHWKITAPAHGLHTGGAGGHAVAKLIHGGKTLITKRWSGKLALK